MRIKSLLLQTFLFCTVLVGHHSAFANTHTYSLNAAITEIGQNDLNAAFSVGSALTGQFTLDDTKLDTSPFPNSSWYLGSVTQAHFDTGSVSVDVLDGYTGVQSSIGSISFVAGPLFGVGGVIGTNTNVKDWTLAGWSLMLTDTKHIISNNNYPDVNLLENNDLHRSMYLTYINQVGDYAHVIADVSGIASISPVPEPSAGLMMGAGLLALLFTRRKRQG